MAKILIIAEKPSLESKIRMTLQKYFRQKWQKRDGYFESSEYITSHFYGHLFESLKPSELDAKYKKWVAANLPVNPSQLVFRYKPSRNGRAGTKIQGKLLAKLASGSSIIINACDPDREGEGIFRIWYRQERIQKPVKRLWAHSLAEKDLAKSFKNLQNAAAYDNLGMAQQLRSLSDWLVGMNATMAYSIAAGSLLSIGRVRTPTLALIVARDYQVEHFKESFTYSLTGLWQNIQFTYYDKDGVCKFDEEKELHRIVTLVTPHEFWLKSFSCNIKKQNPPKPFCMPELQKAANKRFNFSLDKTLTLTQSLYEKRLVTYPRTDSPYLPIAELDGYYDLIDSLVSENERALLRKRGDKPPCVKNTDAAHTAIIPTGEKMETVHTSDDEKTVYTLIRDRFIGAFMKPRIYKEYTLAITDKEYEFRAVVQKDIDPGFKKLYKNDDEEKRSPEQEQQVEFLDEALLKSARERIKNLTVNQIKAVKPKHYTPATLLSAMINVGRTVENKALAEILNDVEGLGTAATRDQYPKELIKNGYIEQKGKYLVSTPKGRHLIAWVHEKLKSPELTAEWEQKLRKIERGEYPPEKYRAEMTSLINEIIKVAPDEGSVLKRNDNSAAAAFCCPKCIKPMKRFRWGYACCDHETCGFSIPNMFAGKKLSDTIITALVKKKKSPVISGFKRKDGTGTYDAKLILNDSWKLQLSFDMTTGDLCPKCQKALVRFKAGLKCTDMECGFILWKTQFHKRLTDYQLKQLLNKGATGFIQGLRGKSGKVFRAKLFLKSDFSIGLKFQ